MGITQNSFDCHREHTKSPDRVCRRWPARALRSVCQARGPHSRSNAPAHKILDQGCVQLAKRPFIVHGRDI